MIKLIVPTFSRRKGAILLLALTSGAVFLWNGINEHQDKEAVLIATLDRIDHLSKNITSYGVDIVSILNGDLDCLSWFDHVSCRVTNVSFHLLVGLCI